MFKKIQKKSLICFLSIIIISGSLFPISVIKAAEQTASLSYEQDFESMESTDNNIVFTSEMYDGESIIVAASNYYLLDGSAVIDKVSDREDVLIWDDGDVSYHFTVPKTACYSVSLTYFPMEDTPLVPEIGIKIDGVYLFDGAQNIQLERFWVDANNEVYTDSVGNQYPSEQKNYDGFLSRQLKYKSNAIEVPYEIELTSGEHVITLSSPTQRLAIAEVLLTAPENPKEYSTVVKDYSVYNSYSGNPIVIEGENANLKTTMSLVPKSDNGSAFVNPSSATVSLLNYIGGTTWKTFGDEIIWDFNAPVEGLYKIGFKYKQSDIVNGYVYRCLRIDDKIPFSETQCVKFGYSTSWQIEQLSDDEGEPLLVYLDKGPHTVSLSVTLGEMSDYYNKLKDLIFRIGTLYLDIVMITGENPDSNRDYDLFKQIPDFSKQLEDIKDELIALSKEMVSATIGDGSQYISTINSMVHVLEKMIDNPYTAHVFIPEYSTQYTNLGALLSDMTQMPLKLDQIQFVAPDGEFENAQSSFFSQLFFDVKRFLASFTEEYNSVSVHEGEGKQIKIWCNWGRDQAMVLNSLIQQSFTPQYGINVNLELTNASLINGIISNTQPDLQLHMSRTEPLNLAMRGALYDLSQFEDYESVMERFGKSAGIPYVYNEGHYALPDTQNFYVMFYRSDILKKLGIEIPNTWDEFLETAAVIMRNNMTVYLPYTQITTTTTVNTGVGGLNIFPSIMQQYGIEMYNSNRTYCNLKEAETLKAFSFWTEMYTKYKIPKTQNFYNRFKAGTCPLGIEVYTQYTQIEQAAPEIDGLWGIALVPGVKAENGTINRSIAGSGTGCAILQKSDKKDLAWEFLKWWTSAETQLAYNNGVESILGAISRTTTANLAAFESMAWGKNDLQILLEQRNHIIEVSEVPGSYYVARSVDQAYWSVVNGDSNPKDALIKWGEIANNEIKRKTNQYK